MPRQDCGAEPGEAGAWSGKSEAGLGGAWGEAGRQVQGWGERNLDPESMSQGGTKNKQGEVSVQQTEGSVKVV